VLSFVIPLRRADRNDKRERVTESAHPFCLQPPNDPLSIASGSRINIDLNPKMKTLFLCLATMFFLNLTLISVHAGTSPPEYTFTVVNVFPHDSTAFTQGLAYKDGFFYEGTGLTGQSSLRKVRVTTGEVVQRADLASEFFGEGIALVGDEILQLTWTTEVGFVYSARDFRFLRKFSYKGEGWGLASSGGEVYMSDGTDEIRVLDGRTFQEKRRLKVRDGNKPITELNELEIVEGEIYANVWQTDRIARISPRTGRVTGWIDLTGILDARDRQNPDAVLNGIAYDPVKKRLFVTGKLWPKVFEIRVAPKKNKK
jgi:glutamine cyclotransferase